MHKTLGIVILAAIVIVIAVFVYQQRPDAMTLAEARTIATAPESECALKGVVGESGTYNENSKTWWIDFTPKPEFAQQQCSPACVVDATHKVEINWRCTGAIPGESFSADGNLIRNSPGFKPDVWYLSYEMPGQPGLSVELDLNSVDAPYIDLREGKRVHVEGMREGGVLLVKSITAVSDETGMRIKLYYYNPALDQGEGGVQCTTAGLVAVDRVIPKTMTPLKDAIQLLLRGEISEEEKAKGVTTEFPLAGVRLEKATIENRIATLLFADPQNKTGGGSCRVSILWHQIEATAKQFPTVQSVRFMPEELFQP